MESINWLFELKEKVPAFLERLKGEKIPGFYNYSLSGDLHNENTKWGLGNTVFAIKIYYTLDLLESLAEYEKEMLANFIMTFQTPKGEFYDPVVRRGAFFREKLVSIRTFDFNNFWHRQTIRAETRQSISSLKLLGKKIINPCKDFLNTEEDVKKYSSKLDWTRPWGAGSHFSHLVFFLENSDLKEKEKLINFAINCINKLQNSKDGSWYLEDSNLQQKINGAMKIITGLKVANKVDFKYPERLIDLCLSVINDEHACDNFNIVYVLKYSNSLTAGNYRFKEIKEFCLKRLEIYKQYYFSEIGGFSFHKNKSNIGYYGAKITKGLNEPDIHGTCLFLWGISIIAQVLEIEDKLGFKEQIP